MITWSQPSSLTKWLRQEVATIQAPFVAQWIQGGVWHRSGGSIQSQAYPCGGARGYLHF